MIDIQTQYYLDRFKINISNSFCYRLSVIKGKISPNLESICYRDYEKSQMNELTIPIEISNSNLIPVVGYNFMCNIINIQSELYCIQLNSNELLEIPTELKEKVTSLFAGLFHICAEQNITKRDQNDFLTFECLGNNNYGQIDKPELEDDHLILDFIKDKTQIKAGPLNTCYNFKQGKLVCWGNNRFHLNEVPEEFSQVSEVDWEFNDIHLFEITISSHFICAIRYNSYSRELKCWGRSDYGIEDFDENKKKQGSGLTSGVMHVCIIVDNNNLDSISIIDERVECWGSDLQSQTVVPDEMKSQVDKIQAGRNFTCAMKRNFYLLCWGSTNQVPIGLKTAHRLITAGGRHSCVHLGGSIACVGNNDYGQLDTPKDHLHNSHIIEAGWDQTCSSLMGSDHHQQNKVDCWGLNLSGQTDVSESLKNKRVIQVASGLAYTCAIVKSDFNVHCWGNVSLGFEQDIDRSDTDRGLINEATEKKESEKIQIKKESPITELSVGDNHVCQFINVSENSLQVLCFGHNNSGQLDIPAKLQHSQITAIASGGAHSCAIEDVSTNTYIHHNQVIQSKQVTCWGADNNGQSTLPPDGVRQAVSAISAGAAHTCISVKDSIVCWGAYWKEQALKQTRSLVRGLSAGFEHDCWVEEDGVAACAGGNEWGQGDLGIFEV